jgi:hypothetical protein
MKEIETELGGMNRIYKMRPIRALGLREIL